VRFTLFLKPKFPLKVKTHSRQDSKPKSTVVGIASKSPGEGRESNKGSMEISRLDASKRSRSSKFTARQNNLSKLQLRFTITSGSLMNFGSIEVTIRIQFFFLFFMSSYIFIQNFDTWECFLIGFVCLI